MKSSYLTNLVLLILVIGLIWFTQHDTQPTTEPTTLSLLKAGDIHHIKISRSNQVTIELGLEQDGWQLQQPYLAKANETRVKLLLSLLSSSIHGQFHPMDPSSLGQFGLASPPVTITFNDHSFAFGNIEPLSNNRYVMYNNIIYLVDDTVMPLLTASADSFIENRLINEHNKLVKLHLPVFNSERSHSTRFVEISQSEGHWQSDMAELSSDTLVALANSWQHAQAMQVHHLDATEVSESAISSVQLWLQGYSEPIQLVLFIKDQNMFLTNPSTQLQYVFPRAIQTELFPAVDTP